MQAHRITMLGTGLIGEFYTMTLHGQRNRDAVSVVYSRSAERGEAFANRWSIPHHTTSLAEAITHPETDVVVVALPNHLHEEAIAMVAAAGKAVLCTKPLGRNAEEARRILATVEKAGVFAGYLEDLCCTKPQMIRARKNPPDRHLRAAFAHGRGGGEPEPSLPSRSRRPGRSGAGALPAWSTCEPRMRELGAMQS